MGRVSWAWVISIAGMLGTEPVVPVLADRVIFDTLHKARSADGEGRGGFKENAPAMAIQRNRA